MRRLLKPAIAALYFAAALPATAEHISCGGFGIMQISTAPGLQTTSSTHYTELVSVPIETSPAGCVHVQFSAQFRSKTPKNVRLRLTVDGAPQGFPNTVNLTTSGSGYDERAVTFIIPDLNSTHTIAIEFLSVNGSPVSVRNGLLRIEYNGPV